MIRQMRVDDRGLKDLIAKLPNDLDMIEVGTYAGESAEIFLKSGKVKKIYCVDLWHIKDWAEAETPVNALAEKYSQLVKVKMSSEKAANEFEDNSVDFIYIDANHYYEPCKRDIENYLPKIKKGGWIGGHDFHMDSVRQAVDETIGYPDYTFEDNSWIKQI